jgi:endonuclease III related protein
MQPFHSPDFLDLPFYDRYRAHRMSVSSSLPQIVAAPFAPVRRQTAHLSASLTAISRSKNDLHSYYAALFAAYGPQHWWPGRTRFEVIVGAILTQNTSWKNAERAIANLRRAKLLSPAAVRDVSLTELASHLRPSGYFRQKTKTLKTFVAFLYKKHRGSLNHLFAMPTASLREQLLAQRGIGPETADAVLLYAGKQPVFVVDAYSRRILERHHLADPKSPYEELRATFESALPRDHQLFNEFHALIVYTGKHFCRRSDPLCAQCPLHVFLPKSESPRVTGLASPVSSHQSRGRALAACHSPLVPSLP